MGLEHTELRSDAGRVDDRNPKTDAMRVVNRMLADDGHIVSLIERRQHDQQSLLLQINNLGGIIDNGFKLCSTHGQTDGAAAVAHKHGIMPFLNATGNAIDWNRDKIYTPDDKPDFQRWLEKQLDSRPGVVGIGLDYETAAWSRLIRRKSPEMWAPSKQLTADFEELRMLAADAREVTGDVPIGFYGLPHWNHVAAGEGAFERMQKELFDEFGIACPSWYFRRKRREIDAAHDGWWSKWQTFAEMTVRVAKTYGYIWDLIHPRVAEDGFTLASTNAIAQLTMAAKHLGASGAVSWHGRRSYWHEARRRLDDGTFARQGYQWDNLRAWHKEDGVTADNLEQWVIDSDTRMYTAMRVKL